MCFGAKSANQSQNNSKGPCEDAGGNGYKSIYIHSKTSPMSTQPERPLTAQKPPLKKPDYSLQLHMGTKIALFGEMSSGLMKQKYNCMAIMTIVMFGGKCLQAEEHHPKREAWRCFMAASCCGVALLLEGLVHFIK